MQDRQTIRRARRLRQDPTGPEALIWSHLRERQQADLRFRRQVPIGAYVVDFACLSIRLIVEVDGGVHALRTHDDKRRDDWLRSQGFTVIRFTNGDVRDRLNEVLARVRSFALPPFRGKVAGGA